MQRTDVGGTHYKWTALTLSAGDGLLALNDTTVYTVVHDMKINIKFDECVDALSKRLSTYEEIMLNEIIES